MRDETMRCLRAKCESGAGRRSLSPVQGMDLRPDDLVRLGLVNRAIVLAWHPVASGCPGPGSVTALAGAVFALRGQVDLARRVA
jgi:hypothetical protein